MTTVYVVLKDDDSIDMYERGPHIICVCSSKDGAERVIEEHTVRYRKPYLDYSIEEWDLDVCEDLAKGGAG